MASREYPGSGLYSSAVDLVSRVSVIIVRAVIADLGSALSSFIGDLARCTNCKSENGLNSVNIQKKKMYEINFFICFIDGVALI